MDRPPARAWTVAMVVCGIVGAGLALIAGAFALFGFAFACAGTDVAAPPSEGSAGDALCTTGVYAWDPLLWLVVAGCAIGAIPASLRARSGRAMALAWLGGVALLALTIVLIRLIDSARESV